MYPVGQAEFYRTEGLEKGTALDPNKKNKKSEWTSYLAELTDAWSIVWDELVVGNFGNGSTLDLMLYSHTTMKLKFFQIDVNAKRKEMSSYKDLKDLDLTPAYTKVVAGYFGNKQNHDLLFYDPKTGNCKLFAVHNYALKEYQFKGPIEPGWDIIVPGRFLKTTSIDTIFCWNKTKKIAQITSINGFDQKAQKIFTKFQTAWDIIVPGKFIDIEYDYLLMYDSDTGDGIFLNPEAQKHDESEMKNYKFDLGKGWEKIIPCEIQTNSHKTDLLLYSGKKCNLQIRFVTKDIPEIVRSEKARNGWKSMAAFYKQKLLVFYDNSHFLMRGDDIKKKILNAIKDWKAKTISTPTEEYDAFYYLPSLDDLKRIVNRDYKAFKDSTPKQEYKNICEAIMLVNINTMAGVWDAFDCDDHAWGLKWLASLDAYMGFGTGINPHAIGLIGHTAETWAHGFNFAWTVDDELYFIDLTTTDPAKLIRKATDVFKSWKDTNQWRRIREYIL